MYGKKLFFFFFFFKDDEDQTASLEELEKQIEKLTKVHSYKTIKVLFFVVNTVIISRISSDGKRCTT